MTAIHKKDMTEFEKGVLHGAQQERQKREEILEEKNIQIKRLYLVLLDHMSNNPKCSLVMSELKALTQPNNPK